MDRVNAWLFGRWRPAGLVGNVPEGIEVNMEERLIDRIENVGEVPAGVAPAVAVVEEVNPVAERDVEQVPLFSSEQLVEEYRRSYTEGFNAGMDSAAQWRTIVAIMICITVVFDAWAFDNFIMK
jgi:hypothetical protein